MWCTGSMSLETSLRRSRIHKRKGMLCVHTYVHMYHQDYNQTGWVGCGLGVRSKDCMQIVNHIKGF